MTNPKTAKLAFLSAILIYGTLGVFVRYAGQPSALVALARSSIGTLFLLLLLAVKRQKIDFAAIRRNWCPLLIAGVLLGLNWVTLFEAYRYTTVAVATLCTYLNPIIIVFGAAILMHEQLTARKLLCIAVALIGMVFVSGVPQSGLPEAGEATGILLALLSAVLYASDVSINKFLDQVPACERTLVQLAVAALVMIPYILLTEDVAAMALTPLGAVLLLIVGVFHTGWCYSLFFGSMTYLPAQTVVLFSYIDPIVAIFLSALLLKEPLGWSGILGAVLVLGSTLISELPVRAAAETK